MKSKFSETEVLPFEEYCRTYYKEHLRRATGARRDARSVRFLYPISWFLALGVPAVGLVYGLQLAYTYNVARVQESLSLETYTSLTPVLFVVAGVIAAFGFILGVALGVSKAHKLLFEAEKLEIELRRDYVARKTLSETESFARAVLGTSRVQAGSSVQAADGEEFEEEDPLAGMIIRTQESFEDSDNYEA